MHQRFICLALFGGRIFRRFFGMDALQRFGVRLLQLVQVLNHVPTDFMPVKARGQGRSPEPHLLSVDLNSFFHMPYLSQPAGPAEGV